MASVLLFKTIVLVYTIDGSGTYEINKGFFLMKQTDLVMWLREDSEVSFKQRVS